MRGPDQRAEPRDRDRHAEPHEQPAEREHAEREQHELGHVRAVLVVAPHRHVDRRRQVAHRQILAAERMSRVAIHLEEHVVDGRDIEVAQRAVVRP